MSNHNEQCFAPSTKRKADGYEIVQLLFSKPEQVIKIISGLQDSINSEDDIEAQIVTTEGKNIFAVKVQGNTVDTVFNVAAFKQMLQRSVPELLAHTAPIIAQIEENLYSVDLEQLKEHVGQHVSELLFHLENDESGPVYSPVGISLPGGRLASQSGADLHTHGKKALFHIAIDVSGSM